MQRIKQLFKLIKGNWVIFFFTVVLTVFHRATFSYVPLFSEYVLQKLEYRNDPDAVKKQLIYRNL